MTRLIRQRTPSACAIATIAMATGIPYRKVLAAGLKCGGFVESKGCSSEESILEELGYRYTFENGEPTGEFVSRSRPYTLSPEYFRAMAWGRRAIFTVPSLNNPDGHHSVYWDGTRVLDPNPPERKRYSRWEDLKPSEMILFREDRA